MTLSLLSSFFFLFTLLSPSSPFTAPLPSSPHHRTTASPLFSTSPELASLLSAIDRAGTPVGTSAQSSVQEEIASAASALAATVPAGEDLTAVPLTGTHECLFSMAPGGSSGKLGPFTGRVSQEFVDDVNFINRVKFFGGAARIDLKAQRTVVDGQTLKVSFVSNEVFLFGKSVVEKPLKGKGVWKVLHDSNGVRVMKTPSLFVLRASPDAPP